MTDIDQFQKFNMIDIDASRKRKIININTSCRKKILILGIALLILTAYFKLRRHKSHTQHGIVSTKKPLTPSIRSSIRPSIDPPIGGFYHFSTVGPPWKSIVTEQMSLARQSKLIDESSIIYVTGLGNIEESKSISDLFTDSKYMYDYNTNIEEYEYPTLKKLEKYCLNNNKSLVWFANSKGSSDKTDLTADWRGVMNHFVLKKWRLCYDLLASTDHTTCGSMLTLDNMRKAGWNKYYAGNMWWAKCSHINRLTRIEKLDQADRYIPELYVTSEPDIGHFNCFATNPHEILGFNKDTASCSENQLPRKLG
jgi:hypothetical protein